MTEYDWPTIRTTTINAFGGDAPRNDLEQRIMDIFAEQPQLVVKTIALVKTGYDNGKIRSPWAILDLNLKEAVRPGAPLTATDTSEKQKRIARAEAWIRSTGCHFDRQTEILLELFDSTGLLHAYTQISETETGRNEAGHAIYGLSDPTGDLTLIDRMTSVWDKARPNGITIEQDADARAAKYREQQAELAALHAQIQEARTPDHDFAPLPDIDYAAEEELQPVGAPDDDIPF